MKELLRFLDDLFSVFEGTTKQLNSLWQKINTLHPSVKFTLQHTTPEKENSDDHCECERVASVPFLDTSCSIKEGQIILNLYRKPTDRNKYLLPDSCHPYSNIENIPYSVALRITRICTEEDTRDQRHNELKSLLMDRNYPEGLINSAICKAKSIPRAVAIRKVVQED